MISQPPVQRCVRTRPCRRNWGARRRKYRVCFYHQEASTFILAAINVEHAEGTICQQRNANCASVPEIHRAFGARGQNVVMVASKLKKVISDHKELSPQDLMDLPHLIENPVFIIRQDDDKQTGDLMLVTDRTASNGDPIVISIKRQGRDSSGQQSTILVTVYPIDRLKQTVLSAQKSNNLLYIRGVRRGPTGYKHTGANSLNASLTDTFNKLRVKSNIRTPRTTFNSGKPPSLISTKDSRPALKNPSSLARTNGYAHIPDRKIWEALSAQQNGIWSRFTAGSAAAHDMVEKARTNFERNLYAKDSLVRPK